MSHTTDERFVFLQKLDAAELVENLKARTVAGASPVLARGADGRVCVVWGGLSRVIADCLRPSQAEWDARLFWLHSEESGTGVNEVLNFFFPTSESKDNYVSRVWQIIDVLGLEGTDIMDDFTRCVLVLEAICRSVHGLPLVRANGSFPEQKRQGSSVARRSTA